MPFLILIDIVNMIELIKRLLHFPTYSIAYLTEIQTLRAEHSTPRS